jgi:hypothetical protein
MRNKPDSVYYAERLAAELKAFETATNELARSAHQELADHYAQLLTASDAAASTRPQRVSRAVNE